MDFKLFKKQNSKRILKWNMAIDGVVENLVTSYLPQIQALISSSMNGNSPFFDVERFATRHRSGYDDNLGIRENWPGKGEYIGLNTWSFLIETTLPIQQLVQGPFNNPQTQLIFYDQSYGYYPTDDGIKRVMLVKHPINGGPNTNTNSFSSSGITKSDIEIGSGGDYLSNEIFYRVGQKRNEINANKFTGHIHIPGTEYSGLTIIQTIETIKEMIKSCLGSL